MSVRVRLARKEEPLFSAHSVPEAQREKLVLPGQLVTDSTVFMRGRNAHGAADKLGSSALSSVVERQLEAELNGSIYSSAVGSISVVNKLLRIVPFRGKYAGDVGDVVVGRIAAVGEKRWRVELNSKQKGVLNLESINLPGGVRRRKTEADALQMRKYFRENDLISAEVQQISGTGALSIHTRSLKYGKLNGGQLVVVNPFLIKRGVSSFLSFDAPLNVSLILGINGYCWVSVPFLPISEENNVSLATEEAALKEHEKALTEHTNRLGKDPQTRHNIALCANLLKLCDEDRVPISKDSLEALFAVCIANGVRAAQLLDRKVWNSVLQAM